MEKGITLQLQSKTPTKFTTLISGKLHKNYDTLSALFSSVGGNYTRKVHHSSEDWKGKRPWYIPKCRWPRLPTYWGTAVRHTFPTSWKHTGFTSSYFKQVAGTRGKPLPCSRWTKRNPRIKGFPIHPPSILEHNAGIGASAISSVCFRQIPPNQK